MAIFKPTLDANVYKILDSYMARTLIKRLRNANKNKKIKDVLLVTNMLLYN